MFSARPPFMAGFSTCEYDGTPALENLLGSKIGRSSPELVVVSSFVCVLSPSIISRSCIKAHQAASTLIWQHVSNVGFILILRICTTITASPSFN